MTLSTIQNSFVAGEISPDIFGRTDLAKYKNGASTYRNMFVNYRGGAFSRAGLSYVGTCFQTQKNRDNFTDYPPRDITFQFNLNQGYVLEFGNLYLRIKYRGSYVTEATNPITTISQASPGVFTYTNTNYTLSNDDWIFVTGVGGMTEFNGLTWIVYNVSGSTFSVKDLFGNPVNTSNFSAYTSGGTLARIYTVVAPYNAVDLPFLKFTQSTDTMSLTCLNQDTNTEYPPYDLVRNGNTNWVFTQLSFASSISAPVGVSVTAQSSTSLSTWYSYVVTAVNDSTGEESVASISASVENNDISINAGSNTINWTSVSTATSYRIYAATPSYSVGVPAGAQFGYIGTAFGTSFTDTNITADFTTVPPTHQDPFARGSILAVTPTAGGSGYTQSNIGYSITTSTGSGFTGIPVVGGDSLTGFIINTAGSGYAGTDTITIGKLASGTYTFTANPTDGQNIVLNGVTWTFKTTPVSAAQTLIHTTAQQTVAQLASDLNSSANSSINVATYTVSGLVLTITYKTIGTGGNAYTLAAGTYAGSVSGGTLTGGGTGGATASLTIGPETGTYPSVVAYYQQRRVYANTLNNPDTYYFSQPGNFKNMDTSIPVVDSDAIVGTPWAQQINGIQFMQPMTQGLMILAGSGAWFLNGGNNSALTPSDQTATSQAYNGCHYHVQPIVVNYDILYVQSKGSIVRDIYYNFFQNVWSGTDMTVLSNHLFNYRQIEQWAYAEEPFKIVWGIRDDGVMLSLTYLKEQDVYGWSHHDTNGFFVSVCSVTEPPVDAVYVITKRYINGQWMYYSERMDNRNWENSEDCFCVDAGLQYPMTFPNATLTPSAANGTQNITSVNVAYGGVGYTSPTIIAEDPSGLGTGATFTATVMGGVITAISVVTSGSNYQYGTKVVITDATGTGAVLNPVITNVIPFSASSSVFTVDSVGQVIRIGNNNALATTSGGITINGGGRATVTSYISGTSVLADITDPITATIPNDPNNTPVPAIANQWSITPTTTTVSGLNHLEGMTVSIIADGGVQPQQVVNNGTINLQNEASAIVVGVPYTCQLQTLYLDPPSQMTVQGKRKNIYNIIARVDNSRGFSVGTNQPDQSVQPNNALVPWTNMIEAKERNANIFAGEPIPLITDDIYVNIPANWAVHGQVAFQQQNPLPLSVLSVVTNYQIGDTPG